ncbi:MAG: hypothetical protein FJ096_08030 [Deltaproteobacteria bacterium]|nr:hypothetical protein [Deltaproteobacteria bacterium]
MPTGGDDGQPKDRTSLRVASRAFRRGRKLRSSWLPSSPGTPAPSAPVSEASRDWEPTEDETPNVTPSETRTTELGAFALPRLVDFPSDEPTSPGMPSQRLDAGRLAPDQVLPRETLKPRVRAAASPEAASEPRASGRHSRPAAPVFDIAARMRERATLPTPELTPAPTPVSPRAESAAPEEVAPSPGERRRKTAVRIDFDRLELRRPSEPAPEPRQEEARRTILTGPVAKAAPSRSFDVQPDDPIRRDFPETRLGKATSTGRGEPAAEDAPSARPRLAAERAFDDEDDDEEDFDSERGEGHRARLAAERAFDDEEDFDSERGEDHRGRPAAERAFDDEDDEDDDEFSFGRPHGVVARDDRILRRRSDPPSSDDHVAPADRFDDDDDDLVPAIERPTSGRPLLLALGVLALAGLVWFARAAASSGAPAPAAVAAPTGSAGSGMSAARVATSASAQSPIASTTPAAAAASSGAVNPAPAPLTDREFEELRSEFVRLHSLRKLTAAEALSRQMIEARPDDAMGYLCLGAAQHDSGRTPEARGTYADCVKRATRGDVAECVHLGGAGAAKQP